MNFKLCSMATLCLWRKSILATIGVPTACIILCLLINSLAHSQTSPLKIGDQVSNIPIRNILNHPTGASTLTAFRGKLLILDFWATWCSPCVASFPKLESLQRIYSNEIAILPVTYQSGIEVEKLFKKLKSLQKISLPMATNDSTLRILFPHKELPHYVWIDKNGIVKAITGKEEITTTNIEGMLHENKTQLTEKKDVVLNYDRNQPLLLGNLGIVKEQVKYQTLFTEHIPGLSMRQDILRNEDLSYARITLTNATLPMLYGLAWYNGKTLFDDKRIIIESKDSSRFYTSDLRRERLREWLAQNTFCYEVIVPPALTKNTLLYVQSDIRRLFPQYQASIEKRKIASLVLQRTSKVDKLKSTGGPTTHTLENTTADLNNCSVAFLVAHLNHTLQKHPAPVLDATGYAGKIDLHLDANLTNLESVRTALRAYDLDLILKDHEIEMLIIRDTQ